MSDNWRVDHQEQHLRALDDVFFYLFLYFSSFLFAKNQGSIEPRSISLLADHDYYLESITFLPPPFFLPPQKRILFFSSSQDLSRQTNGGLCFKADFTWLVFNPSYLPWSSCMPEPQRQIYHLIDSAVTGTSDEIQFMHKDGRLVTRLLANVLLTDRWSRSFVKRSGSRERCRIRNTRKLNNLATTK